MLSSQNGLHDPLAAALVRKEREGTPSRNFGRLVSEGEGWRVLDVICTAGPDDRPFAERHAWESVSLVMSGTFSYRSDRGPSLISPGTLMLGSVGRTFECSHQYGAGDRCFSFQFAPPLLEDIARDSNASRGHFIGDRLPPMRALAPLATRIATSEDRESFEEIAFELAGAVLRLESESRRTPEGFTRRDFAGIAEVVSHLEANLDQPQTLVNLARIARVSRFHFLRTFKTATGITPHQWILRTRLREAAKRIVLSRAPITQIALDVGFEDLSNFIRSFRAEFGLSPRAYRASHATR